MTADQAVKTASNPLLEYLETVDRLITAQGSRLRQTIEGYVVRNGRPFHSQPLTPDELALVNLINWDDYPPKECYRNSQIIALTMPLLPKVTLRYVEGYSSQGWGFGIQHAWLSLNGKVVDPTIVTEDAPGRVIGTIPGTFEYVGVEMDPADCRHILNHNCHISLIDDWECEWPRLQNPPSQPGETTCSP